MNQNYREEFRPTVLLSCNPDGLGISLVEKLLTNFCRVKIYSKEIEKWQSITSHINQKNFLEITSDPKGEMDYFLFVDYYLTHNLKDYEEAILLGKKFRTKNLFVLPYATLEKKEEKYLQVKKFIKQHGSDFGQLFIGDVFGPRMDYQEGDLVSEVLLSATSERKIIFPSQEVSFYPLLFSEVAGEVTRALFSFGPFNEKLAILGPKTSLTQFLLKVQKYLHREKIETQNKNYFRIEEDVEEIKHLSSKTEIGIAETVRWLEKDEAKEGKPVFKKVVELKPKPKEIKFSLPQIKFKPQFGFTLIIILLILSPFLSFFFANLSLYLAYQSFNQNKVQSTEKYLKLSQATLFLPKGVFGICSDIPIIEKIFTPFYEISILDEKGKDIFERGLSIIQTGKEISSKVFGDEPYEVGDYAEKLSLELDALYQETGFFLSEVNSQKNYLSPLSKKVLNKINFVSLREKILFGKEITSSLPNLLGAEKPLTYLILFQNNMELRPTGGFIGSFALVDFDKGRLTGINVLDVYSADGQLKGHVEPPTPIKNHLGEANWFLRDANWDADFPTSAEKVEWFLGKEMDKSVSGVIAIDLDVIKKTLEILGPVPLSDFDEVVTAENVYEKTQSEVQTNFFPGSTKKASFLTALSRELLNEIQEKGANDPSSLLKLLNSSLEEKHLLVFLHDQNAQKAISSLMYDGGVAIPTCSGNCLADFWGLVEANLGVNKANYFLERQVSLWGELKQDMVSKTLQIKYKNNANLALGLSGRYKNYLRLLLPLNSTNILVKQKNGQSEEELTFDEENTQGRKEIGFLLEVSPGQETNLILSWQNSAQLNFSLPGEYRLYVRKQPGTGEDPLFISLKAPGEGFQTTPKYSLTPSGFYEYNTTLSRDLFSRLSW